MIDSINLIPVVEEVSTKMRREVRRWWPAWLVSSVITCAFVGISLVQVHGLESQVLKAHASIQLVRGQIVANRDLATQIAAVKARHDEGIHELIGLQPLKVMDLVVELIEKAEGKVELVSLELTPNDSADIMHIVFRGRANDEESAQVLIKLLEDRDEISNSMHHEEPAETRQQGAFHRFRIEFDIHSMVRNGEAT